ncbi:hypothetical protein [Nocardia puris]|uniref:hypothetical protein n=1 Tax=Nocardia puris TaxID=208602 RepID=UPI002E1DB6BF
MTDLATIFVGGGAASVVVAVIGWLAARRLNSANYADIAARMAREIADDLREDNAALRNDVETLQRSVDNLRERVGELSDTLRIAITRLDEYGHDTEHLRAVLRGGGRNGRPV